MGAATAAHLSHLIHVGGGGGSVENFKEERRPQIPIPPLMMMTAATRDRAKNNTDWGNLNQRLRLLRKKTAADRVSQCGRKIRGGDGIGR